MFAIIGTVGAKVRKKTVTANAKQFFRSRYTGETKCNNNKQQLRYAKHLHWIRLSIAPKDHNGEGKKNDTVLLYKLQMVWCEKQTLIK